MVTARGVEDEPVCGGDEAFRCDALDRTWSRASGAGGRDRSGKWATAFTTAVECGFK